MLKGMRLDQDRPVLGLPSFIYPLLWPELVGKVSHACSSGLGWCVAFLEPSRSRGQQWKPEPPCTGQGKCPMPG